MCVDNLCGIYEPEQSLTMTVPHFTSNLYTVFRRMICVSLEGKMEEAIRALPCSCGVYAVSCELCSERICFFHCRYAVSVLAIHPTKENDFCKVSIYSAVSSLRQFKPNLRTFKPLCRRPSSPTINRKRQGRPRNRCVSLLTTCLIILMRKSRQKHYNTK